jgi:hypothetical protein
MLEGLCGVKPFGFPGAGAGLDEARERRTTSVMVAGIVVSMKNESNSF